METPSATKLLCQKFRGGKNALWHARHPMYRICGAGNTADNAIRDWQKQFRSLAKKKLVKQWTVGDTHREGWRVD